MKKIFSFFSSLKLALFCLFALALTSIIGTIIPQGLPKSQYISHFSPIVYKIFDFLNLFDMYHSWWFIFLLFLLIANLIFCSLKHFKTTYNRAFKENYLLTPDVEKTIRLVREFQVNKNKFSIEKVENFIKENISKKFKKTIENKDIHYFINKFKYSEFGYYIVHLSLIIIAIGAIIGSIWGFKGFVNIPEGDTVDKIMLRNNTIKELGFKIKCIDFSIKFYPNGAPKEYKSIVEIIDKNNKFQRDIRVNHPLTYKGITFYQANYGTVGKKVKILVKDRITGEKVFNDFVEIGVPIKLNKNVSFLVSNFANNFQGFGPAAQIILIKNNKHTNKFIIFKKFPKFDEKNRSGDYVFILEDAIFKYFTGLEVTKDPGVNIVWFGCFLMILGLYISFFIVHKKYWIKISEKDKKVLIKFAGSMRKDKLSFEEEFNKKFNKFKDFMEGK